MSKTNNRGPLAGSRAPPVNNLCLPSILYLTDRTIRHRDMLGTLLFSCNFTPPGADEVAKPSLCQLTTTSVTTPWTLTRPCLSLSGPQLRTPGRRKTGGWPHRGSSLRHTSIPHCPCTAQALRLAGGHTARRSPSVEPHARVLDWVLAWGCTASGLGWAGGCNPSGRPKREGCSRSTPRSLPSEGQYGHRTKRQGRAECPLADDTQTRIESRLGLHLDCASYAHGTTQACVCRGLYGCATMACIRPSPQQWIATVNQHTRANSSRDRGGRQFLDSLSQPRLSSPAR